MSKADLLKAAEAELEFWQFKLRELEEHGECRPISERLCRAHIDSLEPAIAKARETSKTEAV